MRQLLAVIVLVSALALTACVGRVETPAKPVGPTWTQVARISGSVTGANQLQSSTARGAEATLTARPARLVLEVQNVHGAGTRLYLVPSKWVKSQPVNRSDFADYPAQFLIASADTTGTTSVDVPHESGHYVLVPVGGVIEQAGSTFTAVLEQLP